MNLHITLTPQEMYKRFVQSEMRQFAQKWEARGYLGVTAINLVASLAVVLFANDNPFAVVFFFGLGFVLASLTFGASFARWLAVKNPKLKWYIAALLGIVAFVAMLFLSLGVCIAMYFVIESGGGWGLTVLGAIAVFLAPLPIKGLAYEVGKRRFHIDVTEQNYVSAVLADRAEKAERVARVAEERLAEAKEMHDGEMEIARIYPILEALAKKFLEPELWEQIQRQYPFSDEIPEEEFPFTFKSMLEEVKPVE